MKVSRSPYNTKSRLTECFHDRFIHVDTLVQPSIDGRQIDGPCEANNQAEHVLLGLGGSSGFDVKVDTDVEYLELVHGPGPISQSLLK